MRAKRILNKPLAWDGQWRAAEAYDVLVDRTSRYQIHRSRHALGVDVSTGHPGRRLYVAQAFDPQRGDLVAPYAGFSLERAKCYCELHRQQQMAAKASRKRPRGIKHLLQTLAGAFA